MTEYKTSKDFKDMTYTIRFRTDNTEAAARVESACKREVENDIMIPEPKPCPFCGEPHIGRSVTFQYVGPIGPLERMTKWEGIIGCSECGVYLREYFDVDEFSKVSAEAALVEKWNKRKQP